jgi:hypothetical protein
MQVYAGCSLVYNILLPLYCFLRGLDISMFFLLPFSYYILTYKSYLIGPEGAESPRCVSVPGLHPRERAPILVSATTLRQWGNTERTSTGEGGLALFTFDEPSFRLLNCEIKIHVTNQLYVTYPFLFSSLY